MSFFELFILAIGLSMDAFAVSICKGLALKKARLKNMLACGAWFGGFQALMPFIGFFIGSLFQEYIVSFDHWIAFILLFLIGANMIKEAFSKKQEDAFNSDFSVKTMFTMAVATSIDALAIGVSLALAGSVNIWITILLIGVVTCILSALGVKIGSIFGAKYEKKAQLLGGTILIVLGIKILIEHLFF